MDFYDLIKEDWVYYFPENCSWCLQSICYPHIYLFIYSFILNKEII